MSEEKAVLTMNGRDYPVDLLPAELKNMISIYERWQAELSEAKLEVIKLEAALKSITREVELRIKQLEIAQEPDSLSSAR